METRRTRVLEATVQGPLRVTLPASDYLTASQTKQRRRRQATTPDFHARQGVPTGTSGTGVGQVRGGSERGRSADADVAAGYVVWGFQTLGCNRIWSNCASNEESSGLQAYKPIPTVDPSSSTAALPISSVVSPRRCRWKIRSCCQWMPSGPASKRKSGPRRENRYHICRVLGMSRVAQSEYPLLVTTLPSRDSTSLASRFSASRMLMDG